MKRVIYCFFAIILCFTSICGCQGKPPDRDEAISTPFSAEIRGERDGIGFTAVISAEGDLFSIQYLTPNALSGIEIRTQLNPDGSPRGSAEALCGEIVAEIPAATLSGLLAPLTLLLSHTEGDAATVQKDENGYRYTFPDGVSLSLSPAGKPLSVTSGELSYEIVWWE